jgi:hypothetical protein
LANGYLTLQVDVEEDITALEISFLDGYWTINK